MSNRDNAVAIIGLAGRFPGAASADVLWRLVADGVEAITRLSDEELHRAGVPRDLLEHPRYVKAAAMLPGNDLFDAPFFGISPAEAEQIDPQHRVFLESAWHALENAGYAGAPGERVGVYAGTGMNRYGLQAFAPAELNRPGIGIQAVTGNDKDYLTARVSYKLGLSGPSVCVQSACSTSLVAIHLACRSLLDGEVDLVLAGGVSVRVPQTVGYLYEEGGILSPDGHCRAFDAEARGTIFGSGVGVVVLKRLADALAAGDTIRAVLVGSAVNNDGNVKAGFTAPGVDAQAAVIAEALAMADVDARTIGYLEAHGTGTTVGDPIEVRALTKAFRGWTGDRQFCALGSVKTNLGHLDVAAGVTGLIKTVLALEHRQIPPSLHFRRANPEIDFEDSPFVVSTALREWTTSSTPRRAGVSSFGLGGTNCHVVLEEAPAPASRPAPSRRYHLVPLSAKSEAALAQASEDLARHVEGAPALRLDDVALVCQVGRAAFGLRRVALAETPAELASLLRAPSPSVSVARDESSDGLAVAFLFPGQGAHFARMGAELYDAEAVFRSHVDAAADIVQDEAGFDVRAHLRAPAGAPAAALDDTHELQPVLFALEYALAQLWLSWGIRPHALIGHSLGEYVAASVSGVMSFEDALRLVVRRSRLMSEQPRGSMLAVAVPEHALRGRLPREVAVAAVNQPDQTVVSGPLEVVAALADELAAEGLVYRRLATSHAFHSAMMDPLLERFREVLRAVELKPPQVPYVSNVTGTWIRSEEATSPDYWTRHVRETVRFADGLGALLTLPDVVLLETGPGHVLTRCATALARGQLAPRCLVSMPELRAPGAAMRHLYRTLGELWLAGAPVAWERFQEGRGARRVPLPAYPFQRQRYWRSAEPAAPPAPTADPAADQLPRVFVSTWRQVPPTVLPREGNAPRPLRLIFSDRDAVPERFVQRLADGMQAVIVEPGERFEMCGPASYVLDLERPEDYSRLVESVAQRASHGLEIVHLLSLGAEGGAGDSPERRRTRSFYSLLWIAKALGKHWADKPTLLTIVSTAAQAVTAADVVVADRALLTGPFRVIGREYPHVACRWVDVDHLQDDADAAQLVQALAGDAPPAGSAVCLAYRRGRRFEPEFIEVRLRQDGRAALVRQEGTYLITGGFGGIGLALARVLAREQHAKLILIGRTPLPERDAWDALLREAPPEGDALARRVRAVQELEALGATVLPLAADVADETGMRAALDAGEKAFGPLDGVVHAAGMAGGGLIVSRSRTAVEGVLRPKVDGTRVLSDLLASRPLDFFVCCSSLQSLLGEYGQSDYCAANAFLDAFAHQIQRTARHPCLSINWDTWRNVGMAAHADAGVPVAPDVPPASGLTSSEGVTLLLRLLSSSNPQLVVCRGDLHERLQARAALRPPSAPPLIARRVAPHRRPDLFTPFAEPQAPLERLIAGVWEQVLGVDRVGLDDSLFELGGDSVSAIQVAEQLQAQLGTALPPVRLFSASTVRELAQLVAGHAPAVALDARRERGARRRARRTPQ
jgi:acyl transferase domain-containing protein/acyl carrier protein